MKLEWQGPTTPRKLRERLGYTGAELLLCKHTGLVIDYAGFGQMRIIFIHEGDEDGNAVGSWDMVLPVLDTYYFETCMQALDLIDRALVPLADDAGFAPAATTWRMVAAMLGWDNEGGRLRLDNPPGERNNNEAELAARRARIRRAVEGSQ